MFDPEHLDVQLTKDIVPVIYHDFVIKDSGADTPVGMLTKDQVIYSPYSNPFVN